MGTAGEIREGRKLRSQGYLRGRSRYHIGLHRFCAPMTAPLPAVLDYPFATPPPPGQACEITPGVSWIRMPLPFALDHINLWLLAEDDGWTLVDTGYGDAGTRALWEAHFATTLRGRPIRHVVATHFHPDHLGNAAWLSRRFGCPVTMTHSEFLTAHAVFAQHPAHATADTCALFAVHGLPAEQVAGLAGRGNHYRLGVPELPGRFARILDRDLVRAGGAHWQVRCGYGHSPEHASLHDSRRALLVSGDMLLPRISTNIAVWPATPDGDPLARFLASIAAFDELPPDTLVLPSHGLPFRGIPLRVGQLQAHHAARLAELEVAVRAAGEPVSAARVLPILFRRELDLQQHFFAMGEAIAHLNHLWHLGRIRRSVATDGAVRFTA
jgi:glyoxylase-like metal-dependent hydrolase (beta-lactamase superfamily II)